MDFLPENLTETVLKTEDGKPVVCEFVAISRTRSTGELVALGHRYEDRDLPCATKSVVGCDVLSLNGSANILHRLEGILSEDYDREDRQKMPATAKM